jgi:hypothetical protein
MNTKVVCAILLLFLAILLTLYVVFKLMDPSALGIGTDIIAVLSGIIGSFLTSFFWYEKAKKADEFGHALNKYGYVDSMLHELSELHDFRVSPIIEKYRHVESDSPILLFNKEIENLARAIRPLSFNRRKGLIRYVLSQSRDVPSGNFVKNCVVPGCSGRMEFYIEKGSNINLQCPVDTCKKRYVAYISGNNKLIFKLARDRPRRVTYSNFNDDIIPFLDSLQLYLSPPDVLFVAKMIAAHTAGSQGFRWTELKSTILSDTDARREVSDIKQVEDFLNGIYWSKYLWRTIKRKPGAKERLSLHITEEEVYIAYVEHVSHKLKEFRQVIVNREIVGRLIDLLLPKNALMQDRRNEAVQNTLDSIRSVDR